jgi:PAS domain S-box-containing protein
MTRKPKAKSPARKPQETGQARLRKLEKTLAAANTALKKETASRKRAEDALRQAEAVFWSFVNQTPALVCLQDEKGRYVFCNGRIKDVYGHRPENLVGKTALEWWPGETGKLLHEHGLEALLSTRPTEHIELIPEKNGTAHEWLMVRFPFRDHKGKLLVGAVGVEITAQRQAEASLRQLAGRILNLQDEERRRIARDLHDTAAQTLSALALNLAITQNRAKASGDNQTPALLVECLDLAEQASKELRDLSHLLYPPDLDRIGLVPAIQWHVLRFGERAGINVSLDVPSDLERLSHEAEAALFRVLQESLVNVQRHSGSAVAQVRLKRHEDRIVLEIEDQGRGASVALLTPPSGQNLTGVGVAGMQERLRQVGGQLQIESVAGQGTTVRAIIPMGAPALRSAPGKS